MATTDNPRTLSELQTAFLDTMKEVTGNSAINTILTRYLNLANHDIHQEKWAWAERRATIRTYPPYSTGTVDVAITDLTARKAVTGTGTLWTTANSFGDQNGRVASKMILGASPVVHQVATVGGAGSITLADATPYSGDTALDDATYRLYDDEYALAADFGDPIDVRFFDHDRTISLMGAQEFYRLYATNFRPGKPKVATLIELGPATTTALRPRVLFGPAPDKTYIIPYRYTTTHLAVSSTGTQAANLTAASDEPIVPVAFRQAIVWKALELWFSTRQKNPGLATDFAGRYSTLMLRARQKFTPADDRPRLQPMVAGYRAMARRPWRSSGGRYDGGPEWDQLQYR